MEPEHLGDGAYISVGSYRGEYLLTANHHDPRQASDCVCLDPRAMAALKNFVERAEREDD